jgi:hypothetical protein
MSVHSFRDESFQRFIEAERRRPVQRNLFSGEIESIAVESPRNSRKTSLPYY